MYGQIRAGGSITPEMIFHATNGGLLGRLDLVSRIRERTGFEYMRVKRTVLMDAMLRAVQEAGIEVRFGERLVAVNEDENETGVTAKFESGKVDMADLLVGCDGIHSAVRSSYVNPGGVDPEYSGVSSMSSIIKMETDLEGMNITFTARGSMVVLPCVDAAAAATAAAATEKELFWFITRHIAPPTDAADARDGWNEHRAKEVESFKSTAQNLVQDVKGDWGDFLRNVIDHTESVNFYPIYRLQRDGGPWHRGRCVLVGDAAHAMSPHVGQGVSMALEDVFLLTRVLGPQAGDESLEEMLGRFERIRRPRVGYMAERAASNGRASLAKNSWQVALMEWSLWAWLWKSWLFGGMSWGSMDDDLAYDIDEVDIHPT